MPIKYTVKIVEERHMLWAHVDELPGTFASGEDLRELFDALLEAIEPVEPK